MANPSDPLFWARGHPENTSERSEARHVLYATKYRDCPRHGTYRYENPANMSCPTCVTNSIGARRKID